MNGLSETHSKPCLAISCKASLFHSQFIRADSKLLCSKETLLISCYRSRLIGQRVVQRNCRVGNDSAAGVAHNALKSCSNSRRLSGSASRAKQQGKRYGNPDCNMTRGKRTASKNHLESPRPINVGKTKKYVLVELQGRPITTPSTDGATSESVLGSGIADRKSTRLNSSHVKISYAVFCLKKKRK